MTARGFNIGLGTVQERGTVMQGVVDGLPRPAGRAVAAPAVRSFCDSADGVLSSTATVPLQERAAQSVIGTGVPTAEFLIIDDCTLQRETLATVVCREGMSTPAVAWDLLSLQHALAENAPQVVLLSVTTRDSIALLRAVRQLCPAARVIVVGIAADDEDAIIGCAEAGVAGYHMRTDSIDDLLQLMSKVANGESACPPEVSAVLINHLSTLAAQKQPSPKELVLTIREMQILKMLEMGLSNRDIADQLCITLHTVKNHVHSVLNKLGVSTRTEAAAISRSLN